MLEQAWVGLDVGTTSSKAVAYSATGAELGSGRAPTVWRTTPLGVELDPAVLLDSALSALASAVAGLPPAVTVAGVGVTSMGETGVLVDASGAVCAPSIAWHDTRDAVEVAELGADLGEESFGARAGKPLRGQFSITKHRWLLRHVRTAERAARRFNVAEWVARGLGAAPVCDRALACRTGWYDLAGDGWWGDALEWSGATEDLMPDLVDSGTPLGSATSGHPRLHGAVVTTAGHDHQAAALGAGATGVGDELDSSGTAEALVRTVAPGLTGDQVLTLARGGITTDVSIQPGRWSLLGGTEGGLHLQQALDALGVDRDGLPGLDAESLSGEGSRGARWRAAAEQATDEAVILHAAISAVAGPHARLIVTGGWRHSAAVMAAKRAGFGALEVSPVAEAGTLGAATLAARAAGELADDEVLGHDEVLGA
ncbi:FGGY family carbohydrate kinase [Spongisporangium articulatum]|uniref:FGGY family carbohydrate kinase n=1 Tax=Spongisporangium articulatum TaxID=3362603 RepID=A0ABW8AGQ6_9ACTN